MNLKNISIFLALASLITTTSCSKENNGEAHSKGPVSVGFQTTLPVSKVNIAGNAAIWKEGDCIALFARGEGDKEVFSNQRFVLFGAGASKAVFTSELSSPMESGTYTYAACYPMPEFSNGTEVTLKVPSIQKGTGENAAILVSDIASAAELKPQLDNSSLTNLELNCHHLTHILRFSVNSNGLLAQDSKISRLSVSMDSDITGEISLDLFDKEKKPSVSYTGHEISIVMDSPVRCGEDEYAYAAILPCTSSPEGQISVEAKGLNELIKFAPVMTGGREFAQGHITTVRLNAISVQQRRMTISLDGNNIGEDVIAMRLIAPQGVIFEQSGSNIATIANNGGIGTGSTFTLKYRVNEEIYSANSFELTAELESKHVICNSKHTLADIAENLDIDLSLSAPYLLYEDFSGVETFSSNDGYTGGFSSGGKESYEFLNGWSGERIGAQAGKCVRTAARRETSARYPSRLDSAPIAIIKSPVDIEVKFDYGTNNQFGGIGNGDYGQNIRIGYITTTEALGNASTEGTFESGNTINSNVKDGSWNATPRTATITIHNMAAGNSNRISWSCSVENHSGANNTTCWMYIDNITVKVKQ